MFNSMEGNHSFLKSKYVALDSPENINSLLKFVSVEELETGFIDIFVPFETKIVRRKIDVIKEACVYGLYYLISVTRMIFNMNSSQK